MFCQNKFLFYIKYAYEEEATATLNITSKKTTLMDSWKPLHVELSDWLTEEPVV